MKAPTSLAQAVYQSRQAAGVSLRDLAERSGVNKAVISRIESGERVQPRADTLKRLAEALSIAAEDLFAAAGWTVPAELPSFQPYLRTKYGHLPPDKLTELEGIFRRIADEQTNQE